MSITNITELRNDALYNLERLKKGEIGVDELGAISKVYQNIMVSLKLEMEVASLLGVVPEIEFMGTEKLIERDKIKLISKK